MVDDLRNGEHNRVGGEMIVEIARTSKRYSDATAPVNGAYKERRLETMYCTCKSLEETRREKVAFWFWRGDKVNQRETSDGRTACDSFSDVWLLDIPSFESLIEETGEDLVISFSNVVDVKYKVEIYDAYRE